MALAYAFHQMRPHLTNGIAIATDNDKNGLPLRSLIAVEGLLRVDDVQNALRPLMGPDPLAEVGRALRAEPKATKKRRR